MLHLVGDAESQIQQQRLDRVEAEVYAQRLKLARILSKYVRILMAPLPVIMVPLWFAFPQHTQFIVYIFVLLPVVILAMLFPIFDRQQRVTQWSHLFIFSFFIMLMAVPLIFPTVLNAISVAYLLLFMIGNQIVGDRPSLWVLPASGAAFVADYLLIETGVPQAWFLPLDHQLLHLLGIGLGLFSVVACMFLARVFLVSYDKQFRQMHYANMEVEQRIAADALQREELEIANLEIEKRIAVEMQQREALQALIEQIRQSVGLLESAATEILAASSQQSASALEQDSAVTQTVATVEEVRVTVSQTAERAKAVASAASESVHTSRSGQEAVTRAIEGMTLIRERVEAIAKNILVLSDHTQQIGEIIETVNGLAEQSKLLALNASIEAARAGNEGRGFAVVAMEVRQLAEQSHQATARVHDILNEIQQATNTAVIVTEDGSKGTATGMTLVEQAGEAIRELAATIEQAAQAAAQIAASTQQQNTGMSQLASAMEQIKAASSQTAISAQQTEQNVRDLIAIAQQLQETAAQYQS
jgi:methyl-accepting chemotaxis protein